MQVTKSTATEKAVLIPFGAVFAATIRAFAVFMVLDFVLEWAFKNIFNIDVKEQLPSTTFDITFSVTYFAIIFMGLFGIFILYVVSRSLFQTRLRAAIAVGVFVYVYTGLMMLQLYNLGVLPGELFVIMGISNIIELPVALVMGVVTLPPS